MELTEEMDDMEQSTVQLRYFVLPWMDPETLVLRTWTENRGTVSTHSLKCRY